MAAALIAIPSATAEIGGRVKFGGRGWGVIFTEQGPRDAPPPRKDHAPSSRLRLWDDADYPRPLAKMAKASNQHWRACRQSSSPISGINGPNLYTQGKCRGGAVGLPIRHLHQRPGPGQRHGQRGISRDLRRLAPQRLQRRAKAGGPSTLSVSMARMVFGIIQHFLSHRHQPGAIDEYGGSLEKPPRGLMREPDRGGRDAHRRYVRH